MITSSPQAREALRALARVVGAEWAAAPSEAIAEGSDDPANWSRPRLTAVGAAGAPSARPLLGLVAQAVGIAARVRAFAAVLAARLGASRAVLAFAEAVQAEVQRLDAWLWRLDAAARRAQQAQARGARGGGGGSSLLHVLCKLRGAQGWLRALHGLDEVVEELRQSTDAAAVAVEAEEDQQQGAAARATSRLVALLLARVSAEQRHQSTQGPMLRMVPPFPPARPPFLGLQLHPSTLLLAAQWLRLLLATLAPYLRLLQHWVCEGALIDPASELPLLAAAAAPCGEKGWTSRFLLRPAAALPPPLRPHAPHLLLSGKSRHLLAWLPQPPPPVNVGAAGAATKRAFICGGACTRGARGGA